ncbi:hypothetical protein [Paracoccus sp. JM45]|uniref:hypothetical protein n=1 Tax=Paracoccus sp. JM45 TaxID=2283626 RepID=UPI000E6B603B|nr:hypothetical protein [Paracoccus sp. JM45]RJE80054.1 hypothetical protein DWB67_07545 [Paracoccus sp. JM45]
MSYDPNDPNRPQPGATDHKETYVEPVERKSSALPLIIGVLLALALAYFVLQRFMTDDTVAVDGDTTTVTTTENADPTEPEAPAVVVEPAAEEAADEAAVEAEVEADNAAADAEAAAEDAAAAADTAADNAESTADTATEDAAAAASDAADSAAEAADSAAEATGNAVDDAMNEAGETASEAADAAAAAAQDAADALDDAITIEEEPAVTPEAATDAETETTTTPAN